MTPEIYVFLTKSLIFFSLVILTVISSCIFFDHAILVRKGTIFRVTPCPKKVALTFDDGPSNLWTPQILDELKKSGIKATFFMVGSHVKKFPEIAQRVAQEGHTIGNHGYAHSVFLYYTEEELEEEVKYTELVIRQITGQTTKYFRPPKAWLTKDEKRKIRSMGYEVVLWSINSKDWVPFPHQYIVNFICYHVQPGDIILFHDSGGVFKAEGGDRRQTVLAIAFLAKRLQQQGYEFTTIEELLHEK